MDFIKHLESVIEDRRSTLTEGSYTSTLFKGGLDRILKKIGEEAGEVIIAGKNQDPTELRNESADLLFHLLVLLHHQNLTFQDVVDILKSRHS